MSDPRELQWENPQPVQEPYEVEEYNHHKTDIWKTTAILSVITIAEVVFAVLYEKYGIDGAGLPRGPLMAIVAIASAAKAYFIMGVFMHVQHEKRGFKATILLPFLFLVWAIIAFSWDGSAWSTLRSLLNSF